MTQNSYVEDVFVDFFNQADEIWKSAPQDYRILTDFYGKIIAGEELTQNQGNYLLRLLQKYQSLATITNLDISSCLNNPQWKRSFRVLDYTKRIYVEKDDSITWVCLKFPYAFKDTFDKEIDKRIESRSKWDAEKKIRKIDLYQCNLIHLQEFVNIHGFEIDESFIDVIAQVEEIWNQQDQITPYAVVDGDNILIKNASSDSMTYWNTHQTDSFEQNLFLAKQMGYVVQFSSPVDSALKTIVSSESSDFWIKDLSVFFKLYQTIGGTFCILIDRNTQDVVKWLDIFVKKADWAGISRKDLKVCFRDSDTKNSKLNQWIKEENVGGAVKDGKILIFQHKPPKWLFKDDIDVKILATNSFTPVAEPLSATWISGHHCVCYLGDITPTRIKDKKIVEL